MDRHRDDPGQGAHSGPSKPDAGPTQSIGSHSRHAPPSEPPDESDVAERQQITVYGALDLGTNNCRLLLARPTRRGFRVVDAFSRIIRLGEGVSTTGRLSNAAMERTMEALRICRNKLNRNNVTRRRLVATEACRLASNAPQFLDRVRRDLGLDFEILTPETEASLAVSGCSSLIEPGADFVMVFDIGGGSSEIVWLDLAAVANKERGRLISQQDALASMIAWASLPVGVVTLAERFGGRDVTADIFAAMTRHVTDLIRPFEARHGFRDSIRSSSMHMLGTSGTVTTIAGIELSLPRYDRNKVDGCWLDAASVRAVTARLLASTYEERVAEPCIGQERADLVLAGCAILEAFLDMWPCNRLRVADRGLREGILAMLMNEDGVYRSGRRFRDRSGER